MTNPISDLTDTPTKQFLKDNDIAKILSVSPSWVRKQRHLRHAGKDHSLTIDVVHVGSSPRYRASDFTTWLDNLSK